MLENEDVLLNRTGNITTIPTSESVIKVGNILRRCINSVVEDSFEPVQTFNHSQLDHIFLLFSNEVNNILSQRLGISLKSAQNKPSGIKKLKSTRLDGSLTEDELNKVIQDIAAVIREHKE